MSRFDWGRGLAAALAASLPLVAAPHAAAQQDQAQAEQNYRSLAPQADERAGDPAFDYALGIAALDSGRYGEAIIALQRVLAVQPNNAQARAELARAYALAGDIDTAREQFATMVDDPSLPDPVRQRFTGFVRQFDTAIAGGGSDVSGFLDARGGHDSNINSATDLTTVTIPLFAFLGPGTLGAGARAQDDEFYELAGGVSGVTAIGRQDRLFASVLGNWRDNIDSGAFDTASVTGTAGYAHTFANRDVISLSAQAQQFWLGDKAYRSALGAVAQYTHLLPKGRALTVAAQYNRLNFDNQPLLDADRYALAVGYVTRTVSASVSAGHEETRRAAGDAYSNSFATASVGAEMPLSDKIALVAAASFDLRRYDAPDALFLVERDDERIDVQAGVKVRLTDNLYLVPRATWTRNWSNIPLFDYDRWTASAGLRLEF
jgi:tetratricopeptide (TPR) repeat protein